MEEPKSEPSPIDSSQSLPQAPIIQPQATPPITPKKEPVVNIAGIAYLVGLGLGIIAILTLFLNTILSVIFFALSAVSLLAAIILSITAIIRIKRHKRRGMGQAIATLIGSLILLTGLIIGAYVMFILLLILFST